MAELDAATKRLDQSEGGKNALVDQVIMVKLPQCNKEYFDSVSLGVKYLSCVTSCTHVNLSINRLLIFRSLEVTLHLYCQH